jgi:hypothetical protein
MILSIKNIMNMAMIFILMDVSFSVRASDVVLLGEKEFLVLESYLDILEDSTGKMTFEQILSPEYANKFKVNDRKYPYTLNENIQSTYWLRIKIKSSSQDTKTSIIQFNNPTISFTELFYKDPSGNIKNSKAGDLLPFHEREYQYKRITYEVPLIDDTTVVYFKVRSTTYSGFSITAYPLKQFYTDTKTEYYLQGIYLGIILIMVLYNFMTFLAVLESVYIYFCFYALACALYTLNSTRIGFEFLWPDSAIFNLHGSFFIASLLLISFAFYTIRILNLKKYYPGYITMIMGFTSLIILYNGVEEFFLAKNSIAYLSFYLPFLITYIIAWKVVKKDYRPALYFMIGLSFIIISLIVTSLERIDLFRPNSFTIYSLHFAFVAEMLTFSYALSERLKIIKEEKEKVLEEKNIVQKDLIEQYKQNDILKDKVNTELEEKVQQRTTELNEKNKEMKFLYDKIKEQAEQLSKWNLELDLDNRKLSSDIKEVIISRVLHKNVEFEDFNKIFPDDITCFRFLEGLKWENGFKCTICENGKYFEGKATFARRCTKCGYEESLIYNTIFQGSKLALSKQFYMLFLIYHSKGGITSAQLSEILSMRVKTCWAFNKKIKDKMKNHKWSELDGWDAMILLD